MAGMRSRKSCPGLFCLSVYPRFLFVSQVEVAPPLQIFCFCLVSAYKAWQLERSEHEERPISHPAAEQEKKKGTE